MNALVEGLNQIHQTTLPNIQNWYTRIAASTRATLRQAQRSSRFIDFAANR